MVLLLTSSYDITGDLFVDHCGSQNLFRFNYDLFDKYQLTFSDTGFVIRDPSGRQISNTEVTACYWRKPYPFAVQTVPNTELFFEEHQRRYLLRELSSILERTGVWHLLRNPACLPVGKATQMIVAQAFFPVPEWRITGGEAISSLPDQPVVKALIQVPVDGKNFLVTQRVADRRLSPQFCWFVQTEVRATHDVTAVYACGKIFAWCFKRNPSAPLDWRITREGQDATNWFDCDLTDVELRGVQNLMAALKLHFGRLDFLRADDGTLYFLEVNQNGQFAWLDPNDRRGMLSWVFSCAVSPPGRHLSTHGSASVTHRC